MSLFSYSNRKYSGKTFASGRNNISIVPVDASWSNVSLLLHGDGSNNGNNSTILDSSPSSVVITKFGSPAQGSLNPFQLGSGVPYSSQIHGGSCYFNGTSDYLNIANSVATFNTNDFTIECWAYPTANAQSGDGALFDSRATDLSANGIAISYNASDRRLRIYTNALLIASLAGLTLNQWVHVAVTRSGTTLRLFIDGILQGTATNSQTLSSTAFLLARGIWNTSTSYWPGYVSNLRIVKNTALYTSNFTLPTSAPTSVTNTSLLLLFTNSAIYDSAAKINLLVTNDTKTMVAVTKFGSSSIYFDGTGDSINIIARHNFGYFAASNFTIETWWNNNGVAPSNHAPIISHNFTSSTTAGSWALKVRGATDVLEFTYDNGSGLVSILGTSSVNNNQWNHLAVVRNGTSLYLFVNGNLQTTANVSTNVIGQTGVLNYIGYQPRDNVYLNGYIDDLRITANVARYTSSFTPPTEAFSNA